MFWTRLISGIVLVVIALVTILSGGTVLSLTLLAVSLIGVSELYRVLHVRDEKMSPLALCGYLGVILYYAYDLQKKSLQDRMHNIELLQDNRRVQAVTSSHP